ncbi:MAG: L-threonylcarbamoyladenylate synthase [Pseudomonadota bacterium]
MRRKRDRSRLLDVDEAVKRLRAGAVVAYPTETFFGLGVDAMNPDAVETLRQLKGRGRKPISVIIANRDMLSRVTPPLPAAGDNLARAFWPGPLTLIVEARDTLPLNLRANGWTVGVRVSSHIVASALSTGVGGPITSTSCNFAGEEEPTRPEHIDPQLLAQLAGVVEGVTPGGLSSTIVDVTGEVPMLIRQGVISLQRLREVVAQIERGTVT